MDVDDYDEEGIVLPGVEAHIMKTVIIKHPVISLAWSAIIINSLIFFCSPYHRRIEADIPVRLGENIAAIGVGSIDLLCCR